ncbi:MAG: CHAT domain-containing protein [Moorea sp. SIO2B7]|nr:CHAT domain-containing protein [Moorena sp. SIO2B7]
MMNQEFSTPKFQLQLEFLLEALQKISESKEEQQVLYSFLKEHLELLDKNFEQLILDWGVGLLEIDLAVAQSIAVDLINFSILISEFPLGNKEINFKIAIAGYESATKVFTRENSSENWAAIQDNLGIAYAQISILGKRSEYLETAIRYYLVALDIRTRESLPNKWAETQNHLGNAYFYRIQGEKTKNLEISIHHYLAALEEINSKNYPICWAAIQHNLGTAYIYRIQGEKAENLEKAIDCFLAALQIRNRHNLPQQWAETKNSLGVAYLNRIRGSKADNLESAISCYLSSTQVYILKEFPIDWAILQHNLGEIYLYIIRGNRATNLEKAIDYHINALQVRTYESFPFDWSETINNLGTTYDARILGNKADNLESAIYCYKAALQVRTFEAFPERWAGTQNNLGNAYRQRIKGNKDENLKSAIKYFFNALKVRIRESFPQYYAETNWNLGIAYKENQEFDNAYNAYNAAIDTVESLRIEILSGSGIEEDKKKLSEEWNKLYQAMVEVCLELAKNESQYYNQAIEYVERSKARNLVELLANKDIYPKIDIYPNSELYQTHCEQLEQLRRQIPAKQRELEILISNRESEEKNSKKIEQLRQNLSELQQQRDELLSEIYQIDSSFTFSQKVQPITFSDIQALTDENTAIVEWYITDSYILTFIITCHHPHPIIVPFEDIKALENWDKDYRVSYKNISLWIANLAANLQNLANIIHIDGILSLIDQYFAQSDAKCNRLILIPHRYLHLFPLHAVPLADGKLLFENFPQGVGYAPSCQLLKLAKDQEQNRPDFTCLFAIQNPTRKPAQPLLGSQLEIDKIRQHFNLEQSIILKETEATETNLYQNMEKMRSSHCIHFSCHGKFYPESPLKSALLLADPEGKLGEEANLTLGEIFEKLYLNQCRLVTFSACESGMTDPTSISDEYIGLPSGFLYAGSLTVVSTLWSVDPIATTLLMVKFYRYLKRLPQIKTGDVAIALNKAQKWLKTLTYKKWIRIQNHPQFQKLVEEAFANSPKRDYKKFKQSLSASLLPNRQPLPFANPYYWSAFVAIGI